MYQKRGNYNTFKEYVLAKTGKSLSEINADRTIYEIAQMKNAAALLEEAAKNHSKTVIYGDYDTDGITSTAQMLTLLKDLDIPCMARIPQRGQGYGIKKTFLETLPTDIKLLITVDNGISALDALTYAKARGMKVLILDHHIPQMEQGAPVFPPYDVMIDPDPKAIPEGNDFHWYCGAGLSFKLWTEMMHNHGDLFKNRAIAQKHFAEAASFAAIGTVADVVPLLGDNRKIVRSGLQVINSGMVPAGLRSLIALSNQKSLVTSTDIAFKISPMLNSAGRMTADGGKMSCALLLEQDQDKAAVIAGKLGSLNVKRKDLVNSLYESISIDSDAPVNFIRCDSIVGIMGLLAAKLTEATGKPSFVYTLSGTICSGSARSDDENKNDVEAMLASCGPIVKSGGHKGAAGFSFHLSDESAVRTALYECHVEPHEEANVYDLDMRKQEIFDVLNDMDHAEPFGKGLEKPVFRLVCDMDKVAPEMLGKDGKHVCIKDGLLRIIGFEQYSSVMSAHLKGKVAFYGTPEWNEYGGNKTPQFQFFGFEPLSE